MRINTGLVFWGVTLITAGVVALAVQAGRHRPRERAAGVAVLAGHHHRHRPRGHRGPHAVRRCIATVVAGLVVGGMAGTLVAGFPDGFSFGCGGNADETVSEEGSFGTDAEVDLNLNCGDLDVTTAAGVRLVGRSAVLGRRPPDRVREPAACASSRATNFSLFGAGDADQSWDVTLPTDPTHRPRRSTPTPPRATLDLDGATCRLSAIDANAGEVDLRLPGASVGELSVEANAGSISIDVDDGTELAGSVEMNAGSLDLCVPDGVGLAITMADDNVTFSHNLDELGLTREGDVWRSGSGDAITLSVEGNAASFTLNPDGGCS